MGLWPAARDRERFVNVLQIVGPSYSGSTALGYCLNTVDGYFFGSEVRRLLRTARERQAKAPTCDVCGTACAYWGETVLRSYARFDTLTQLYTYFARRHPDVACFVDGSKMPQTYEGTTADRHVLCIRHPVRILASTLHNARERYGIAADDYEAFRAELSDRSDLGEVIAAAMAPIRAAYGRMTESFPDHIPFHSDRAHLDDFAGFRALERALDLPEQGIRPQSYSEVPCHSIGGNRAPLWISTGRVSKDHKSARNRFYAETEAIGDWRIDNKYAALLSDRVLEVIAANDDYRACMDLLGYSHREAVETAAAIRATPQPA